MKSIRGSSSSSRSSSSSLPGAVVQAMLLSNQSAAQRLRLSPFPCPCCSCPAKETYTASAKVGGRGFVTFLYCGWCHFQIREVNGMEDLQADLQQAEQPDHEPVEMTAQIAEVTHA